MAEFRGSRRFVFLRENFSGPEREIKTGLRNQIDPLRLFVFQDPSGSNS